jgi:hypothetical protein
MGSKASAPPAPDYKGAAIATAQGNQAAAQQTTAANRPNINTPFGSQTWTNDKTFDQAGFDQAQAAYNTTAKPGHYESVVDGDGNNTQHWVAGTNPTGIAPDRNQFSSDNWTQNTTLAPTAQKALDSQMAMQQGQQNQQMQMLKAQQMQKPGGAPGGAAQPPMAAA